MSASEFLILTSTTHLVPGEDEIEAKFGQFDKRTKEFTSSIDFNRVMAYFKLYFPNVKTVTSSSTVFVKNTGVHGTSIRRIVHPDGKEEFVQKTKIREFNYPNLGYRITKSKELVMKSGVGYSKLQTHEHKRERRRMSFFVENGVIRYDLTKCNNDVFELEIEIVDFIDDVVKLFLHHVSKMASWLQNVSCDVRQDVYSFLYNLRIEPAQPRPFEISKLLSYEFMKSHAITLKLDGTRRILVFLDGVIYNVKGRLQKLREQNLIDTFIIGEYKNDAYNNQIIDTEFVDTSFFAFDIIRKDVIQLPLIERLDVLKNITSCIALKEPWKMYVKPFFFVPKETPNFFTSTLFFTNVQRALVSFDIIPGITSCIENDGLIFQPTCHLVTESDNEKPYKWKPCNKITNDYLVTNEKKFVLQRGDSTTELYVPGYVFIYPDVTSSIIGKVVEVGYKKINETTFQICIERVRHDKPVPNNEDTVISNFLHILEPITLEMITGKDFTSLTREFLRQESQKYERMFNAEYNDMTSKEPLCTAGRMYNACVLFKSPNVGCVHANTIVSFAHIAKHRDYHKIFKKDVYEVMNYALPWECNVDLMNYTVVVYTKTESTVNVHKNIIPSLEILSNPFYLSFNDNIFPGLHTYINVDKKAFVTFVREHFHELNDGVVLGGYQREMLKHDSLKRISKGVYTSSTNMSLATLNEKCVDLFIHHLFTGEYASCKRLFDILCMYLETDIVVTDNEEIVNGVMSIKINKALSVTTSMYESFTICTLDGKIIQPVEGGGMYQKKFKNKLYSKLFTL